MRFLRRARLGHSGEAEAAVPISASADDHDLLARMDDGVANRCLWRDPEVMLALLARSLRAPAKMLPIAQNRVTRQISRCVTARRSAAASANLQRGALTQAVLDERFWKSPSSPASFAKTRQKPRATRAARPTQKPDFALIASFFAKPFQNQKIPPITPSSEEWRSGLTHRS